MVFSKSEGHFFGKKKCNIVTLYKTQSETKYFRHKHQVKMSKTNTELHEIEYYFAISNVQGMFFCNFTTYK